MGSPADKTMDITATGRIWDMILLNRGLSSGSVDHRQNDTGPLVRISSDNPSQFGRYRHDMLWCLLGVGTFGHQQWVPRCSKY